MKLFTQLALVTAIATSGSAFAMQSMDDAALGDTTGQDGLTILIAPPAGGLKISQIAIFDKDALNTAAPTTTAGNEAGAILIGQVGTVAAGTGTGTGFSLVGGPITIKIDATGGGNSTVTTGTAPMLNVNIKLPASFTVNTGDISVAGAQGALGAQTVDTNNNTTFLTSLAISLPGATMNIQLGNPIPGAAMINLSGTITGGLSVGTATTGVGGIYLKDNTAGTLGSLGVQKTTITSFGSTDLVLDTNIDFDNVANFNTAMGTSGTVGGMVVNLGTSTKFNVYMQGVTLGGSVAGTQIAGESIGDIKLTGLDFGTTKIGITGH